MTAIKSGEGVAQALLKPWTPVGPVDARPSGHWPLSLLFNCIFVYQDEEPIMTLIRKSQGPPCTAGSVRGTGFCSLPLGTAEGHGVLPA